MTSNPSIFPKQGFSAIAHFHPSQAVEDGIGFGVRDKFETMPWHGWIRAAHPLPRGTQGKAMPLKVSDSQSTNDLGLANLCPSDQAFSSLNFISDDPEEGSKPLVKLL